MIERVDWIDPTSVGAVKTSGYVAMTGPAAHKTLSRMQAIQSSVLLPLEDKEWELFSVHKSAVVDGETYYWGMFVEGIGAFDVMVRQGQTRALLDEEKDKVRRTRWGIHTGFDGPLSYELPPIDPSEPEARSNG